MNLPLVNLGFSMALLSKKVDQLLQQLAKSCRIRIMLLGLPCNFRNLPNLGLNSLKSGPNGKISQSGHTGWNKSLSAKYPLLWKWKWLPLHCAIKHSWVSTTTSSPQSAADLRGLCSGKTGMDSRNFRRVWVPGPQETEHGLHSSYLHWHSNWPENGQTRVHL